MPQHRGDPPEDRDRISHMLEAAEDAIRFAADRSREDLDLGDLKLGSEDE